MKILVYILDKEHLWEDNIKVDFICVAYQYYCIPLAHNLMLGHCGSPLAFLKRLGFC
jgi:hypothetical protein